MYVMWLRDGGAKLPVYSKLYSLSIIQTDTQLVELSE